MMVKDVNWWLMALAFVLGLALTVAFTVRRVKREVPVTHRVTPAASATSRAGPDLDGRGPRVGVTDVDVPKVGVRGSDVDLPDVELSEHGLDVDKGTAAAGAAAAGAAAAEFGGQSGSESGTAELAAVGGEPYGPGSARARADGAGPVGWKIKGDENVMRYFKPVVQADNRPCLVPR
jgi:uncharacterized membrane protein ArfC